MVGRMIRSNFRMYLRSASRTSGLSRTCASMGFSSMAKPLFATFSSESIITSPPCSKSGFLSILGKKSLCCEKLCSRYPRRRRKWNRFREHACQSVSEVMRDCSLIANKPVLGHVVEDTIVGEGSGVPWILYPAHPA